MPIISEIEPGTFIGMSNLESIELSRVTEIGSKAFSECWNLKEVSVATDPGVKLEYISSDAFGWDLVTPSITLNIGAANREYVSGNILTVGKFRATFKEILIDGEESEENVGGNVGGDTPGYYTLADFSSSNYPTDTDTWTIVDSEAELEDFYGLRDALNAVWSPSISLEFPFLRKMPSSYNSIDGNVFYNCSSLVAVSMHQATEIGEFAFFLCYNLGTVELPNVEVIGDAAFYSCDSLTSVSIPKATSIGSNAFAYCSELDSFVIPESVTSIGGGAFNGNPKLDQLECQSPYFIVEDGILFSSDWQNLISVPCSCDMSFVLEVLNVFPYAFSECKPLVEVDLPNVSVIYGLTFFNCVNLTTVNCPNATVIDVGAFGYCESLRELSIATESGAQIESIASDAFEGVLPINITLKVGSANSQFVDDDILRVGGFSASFKEIIIVN